MSFAAVMVHVDARSGRCDIEDRQTRAPGSTAYASGSPHAELIRAAREMNADLVVAGGYGHSRLGEWIFGGVTQGMLASSPVCCLLSH
jgi:nucleotide-binding universal stress UspA family protein